MTVQRSLEAQPLSESFKSVVDQIHSIGKAKHTDNLIRHAQQNLPKIDKTLRELPRPSGKKAESGLVICAGPSVHKRKSIRRVIESGYQGSIVAVDAAYIACVREGLIPDYVITLDPHVTRMVRWFGDKEYEKHAKADDYFERQDLNVEFRKNSIRQNQENIDLVNLHGHKTKAIVSSSAPANLVERIEEAKFDTYWWNPLVDDPRASDSLTRMLYGINKLPSMNTGGNVGSAAWVFLEAILKIPKIGLTGMDFGYYVDTPRNLTQTYYELVLHLGSEKNLDQYFQNFVFPLTGESFYADPTYFWYRKNFLQLLEKSRYQTFNCTEGGTLYGERLPCVDLNEFLKS